MRPLLYLLWLGAVVTGCVSPYLDTTAPKDASFQLRCELPAGGASAGRLRVDVAFANVARHYSFGCEHRAQMLARLQTIEDLWCDGLPVAPVKIGTLTVGTTTSEISKQRGATIDDGEGYVAFQCGQWLPKLVDALMQTTCCTPLAAGSPTSDTPPPPAVTPGEPPAVAPATPF